MRFSVITVLSALTISGVIANPAITAAPAKRTHEARQRKSLLYTYSYTRTTADFYRSWIHPIRRNFPRWRQYHRFPNR
jgi:hypothetical protein